MSRYVHLLDCVAGLLRYPDGRYKSLLSEAITELREMRTPDTGDAVRELEQFVTAVTPLNTSELEEMYTRTFDINPECCLEIGWHLFGESYDRGALLVRVRELLARHAIPESTELPDHLTHVLMLVARMEKDDADTFTAKSILPAVGKMLASFEGKDNAFVHVLNAVNIILNAHHSHKTGVAS